MKAQTAEEAFPAAIKLPKDPKGSVSRQIILYGTGDMFSAETEMEVKHGPQEPNSIAFAFERNSVVPEGGVSASTRPRVTEEEYKNSRLHSQGAMQAQNDFESYVAKHPGDRNSMLLDN